MDETTMPTGYRIMSPLNDGVGADFYVIREVDGRYLNAVGDWTSKSYPFSWNREAVGMLTLTLRAEAAEAELRAAQDYNLQFGERWAQMERENAKLLSILEMADFASLWVGDREVRIHPIGYGKWVVVVNEEEWDSATGCRRLRYLDHGDVWSRLPDGFEMDSTEMYAGFHFDGPIAAWDALETIGGMPAIPPTIGVAAREGSKNER